jgi:hypothetical protein
MFRLIMKETAEKTTTRIFDFPFRDNLAAKGIHRGNNAEIYLGVDARAPPMRTPT